jgi:antitoxin HicB
MLSAKHYLQLPYARILIPVEGGFHTEILEFPGCYAQGKTPGVAYKNLERAAESWIEACLDKGQQVPEPSGSVDYSGIVSLRLPKSVHRQAAKFAERDRTSLNTFLLSAVSAKVGAEEFCQVMAQRLENHIATFLSMMQQMKSKESVVSGANISGKVSPGSFAVASTIRFQGSVGREVLPSWQR